MLLWTFWVFFCVCVLCICGCLHVHLCVILCICECMCGGWRSEVDFWCFPWWLPTLFMKAVSPLNPELPNILSLCSLLWGHTLAPFCFLYRRAAMPTWQLHGMGIRTRVFKLAACTANTLSGGHLPIPATVISQMPFSCVPFVWSDHVSCHWNQWRKRKRLGISYKGGTTQSC